MGINNFAYLLLLLVYWVIPLIISIQGKIRFGFQLRYIIPSVIFAGAIFVMWDIRFAQMNIWNFNPKYLTGIELLKLPVEEWLSFIIVPLSSLYIYEWLKVRFDNFEKPNLFVIISLFFLVAAGVLAYIFRARMFSFFTFFLLAIYLGYTIFRNWFKKHYTKFYLSWLVSLIPFVIVSATLNSLTIVTYDVNHIIGIAMFGVPIERIAYLFLLLFINTTIYEYLNNRRIY